ncbi:hypothetical protein CANARDRAFT_9502 [[Candida] arabinofermentans NRRL YB-2248]|uniref:EKC/KEOPS complex subunit CGI121 n=1 Tax=[Candida] arabinofermentans NRRL YB-2248 TaxID=983967 RepID=A0A1E4SVB6_9ASCO|nr:hypothetical protein CANARDRAFT_9502 [[Candida] arabinofermentans NRRL YB-2248]
MSEKPSKVLEFESFPNYKIFVAYFINVQNTDEIKSELLKGNTDYDFAFINGENLLSLEQIYSAVHKCLLDERFNRKKSKTLHTEIIFNLAPQRNIMECLNKFGISSSSTDLLVLKVLNLEDGNSIQEKEQELLAILKKNINGDIMEFDDATLSERAKLPSIKKNYKLGDTFTEDLSKLNRILIGITQLKGL